MTDRYLFRGKWAGEWYYGGYQTVQHDSLKMHHVTTIGGGRFDINPATLGQCTGLKDRNGRLIFDGDIVNRLKPDVLAGEHIVIWANLKWMLSRISKLNPDFHSDYNFFPITNVRNKFLEIIGNVHDNPELLEVKP